MDHKEKYKHKPGSLEDIKNRRRQDDVVLRKEKRDKIISSKRFRFDDTESEDSKYTVEQVKEASGKLLHSKNITDLQILRQACAQGTLYIDALLSVDNSLQCIVGLLSGKDAELQVESAWCITNVSAGTHDHAIAVAKAAAPYLITLLDSSSHVLQDQCAWALGNLAGDGPECRSMLHAQGVVPPLIRLVQTPNVAVVQSSAFALSNLARDSTEITQDVVTAGVIPLLPRYLNLKPENRKILTEISWVLSYLTTSGEHVPALIEEDILTSVVSLLVKLVSENTQDGQTLTPLLRCLGNICSGPDEYSIQACDNPRLLLTLGTYLDSSIRHVVKETLWVLSNMAGEPSVATSIAYGPILDNVIIKLTAGFDIKQEALYVLNNLACHGEEACLCLLKNKILQSVVPILKSSDIEILNLSLCLCELILRLTEIGRDTFEQCEGVERLEGLEYHSNETIAGMARELLEVYFSIDHEDVEKEELVPELEQGFSEGDGYELRTFRDHLNHTGAEDVTTFENRHAKALQTPIWRVY